MSCAESVGAKLPPRGDGGKEQDGATAGGGTGGGNVEGKFLEERQC